MPTPWQYPLVPQDGTSLPSGDPGPGTPLGEPGFGAASPLLARRGVVRPFVRDGKSDVASREGVALILRNVGQVLGTQCSNEAGTLVGEVPWRPRFGSLLYALRHRNLDQTTQELAKVFVAEALARWEPRAQLRAVVLSETSSVSGGNIDTLVMALSLDIRDRDSAVIEQDVKLSLSIQK